MGCRLGRGGVSRDSSHCRFFVCGCPARVRCGVVVGVGDDVVMNVLGGLGESRLGGSSLGMARQAGLGAASYGVVRPGGARQSW